MTGDAPWHSPQLNPWLFARLAWNPKQKVEQLIRQFSLAAFNTDLSLYYAALEKAYQLALDLSPEQLKMTGEQASLNLLQSPPVDMGDPFFARSTTLSAKARAGARIERLVTSAQASLDSAANGNPLLARERETFQLHKAWLQFNHARVLLYRAVKSRNKSQIKIRLEEAKAAYQSVLNWGDTHILDKRHRLNFRIIHTGLWGLRLTRIELNTTRRGLFGLPLWGKTMLQLLSLYQKMRGCYEK